MPPVIIKRYNLVGGENSYSSPAATSESDARKLQSLISSLAGYLEREHPTIPFASAALPSQVGFFHQFNHNAGGNPSVISYNFFCATSSTLYQLVAGAWTPVAAVGTLTDFPVAVNINNLMHFSDGAASWIFDGTNWIPDGLPVPQHAPAINSINGSSSTTPIVSLSRVNGVTTLTTSAPIGNSGPQSFVISSSGDPSFNVTFVIATSLGGSSVTFPQPGLPDLTVGGGGTVAPLAFTVLSNRYYWTTWTDDGLTGIIQTRPKHESSSSPISRGTGPFTNSIVQVALRPGSIASGAGTSLVGHGTDWDQNDVGMMIRVPGDSSVKGFVIASVQDSQHLTLVSPPAAIVAGGVIIFPVRATGWNLYASSSEEDKIGNLLASLPVATAVYFDQSPMIGTVGSIFSGVQRPLLNDPPNPTTRMEVHKNRIWRRDETSQNYTSLSAYEEVLAEQAGSPYESVPGAAGSKTAATQDNTFPLQDQSVHVRGYKSHGDALYIGSELNITPLYGSSLVDFDLSQAQAFAVGLAGKRAWTTCPFGLAFVSYDLKVYLYPSQYSFGVDSTTALVELGRPKRPEFETIAGDTLDQVHLVFYNWGRRNWLVLSYKKTDGTYATWVFDFETKGWMQFQQGYTALAVFEMSTGRKCLVGAASADNTVYAADDLSGSFTLSVDATYPVGIFRDIIDFSDPNSVFRLKDIECETSDPALMPALTVWLDPQDPDNPGVGIAVPLAQRTIGAGHAAGTLSTRFNGNLTAATGATCQRALVEFVLPPGPSNGQFRGYTVSGEKIPDPVF